MTLKQIREKIQLDAGILNDEMFPDARLNEMINQANRTIQVKLNGLGMEKWSTTSTPSVTNSTWAGNNVCYISVPSDYLEGENTISATTVDGSSVVGYASEVPTGSFEERIRNSYQKPTSKYPAMTRMDNKYYIYPRVSTVTFRYRNIVATLSSDSDVPEIPLEYHDMIVDKVVLEVKKINNQQNYVLEDQKLERDIEETHTKYMRNKQEAKNDAE